MISNLLKRKKILMATVAIFAAFQVFSADVHARSLSPLQGLEMLRRSFSGMNDFTAEITQDKQISLMKKRMTASGTVRFRKPDSFYMELYSPYASRLVLKDTLMTVVYPNEGVRQKITLPPEESLKRWFAYLARPVTSLPAGVDIRAETRGKYVILRILPRKKGTVKELRITFLEKSGITRLVIEEHNRDRTVISFRNMKKNVGLDEKDFHIE
jgi:outer membrane lipoprotein carrier protein